MSEQNQEAGESTEAGAPAPTTTGPTTKAASILQEVEKIVSASKDDVFKTVVNSLAEAEKARRVELVKKALDKRREAQNNFRKLNKPDSDQLDFQTGKPIPMITKAKFEEIKKAREALEKIEAALAKALDDNDFSKLAEVCK